MKKISSTPYIDSIVKNYIEQTKEFYPGFEFGSRRSFYSGDEPRNCTFQFRLKSSNLDSTEYALKRNYHLIHYTNSIQNVMDIINSGIFRLSNVTALNDPQEINFITDNLEMKFDKMLIEEYKKKYFVGSFCKVINNNKPDDFLMWRLYGNDGFGAAIMFEIINPNNEWHEFLIANVQYGECNAVKRFKNFMQFHNSFQQANNYSIKNLPTSLSALMALHKNSIWKHEKEVRIFTKHDFDKYSLEKKDSHICDLKHSFQKNGFKYAFVELPLFNGNEFKRLEKIISFEVLKSLIPIIKIKKIILGYRNNYDMVYEVADIIRSLSSIYKYEILVQESHLRNKMS